MNTDFRNSGVTYLEGLAVTDTPASVGTTRLDFSRQKQRKRKMAKPAKKTWRQHFGIEVKEKSQPKPPLMMRCYRAWRQMAAALTKIAELETMLEQAQSDVEVVKEVVDTEDFAKLRDNLPEITKSFSKWRPSSQEKPAGRKGVCTPLIHCDQSPLLNFGEGFPCF